MPAIKATRPATRATVARATEAVAAPAAPAAPLSGKAAANAVHDSAGFTGRVYRGLSPTRNAGSPYCDLTTKSAVPRSTAQLTQRMRDGLRDLFNAYGDKPFPACGPDAAMLATFINSGLAVTNPPVSGRFHTHGVSVQLTQAALDFCKPLSGKPEKA
jgi:hypothetical protein